MNKKTALPIFVILLLVSFVSADINNPNINVGVNYAEINWTSTSLEAGQVFWGEVIPSNTEQETTPTLAHSVRINNLDPSTTYFYRVHSGTDYYPGISSSNNFTTLQAGVINQNRIRLTLDQNLAVTTYSNQTTYAISGTTETDTRIRVYRYLNGLPNQVGMTLPGGSVVYRIDTPLSGEFEFEISLVEGANDFMIEFLNPITYDREQRNFSVTADFTEPNAQFVSLRTDYSQETYKLLGVTDTNTTFEVFVDGAFKQRITLNNPTTNTTNYFTSQGLFLPLSYLYFNTSVNVGVDGLHNLSFVFTDMAGNVNTVNIDDIFFDSEEPEIINISISTITDAPISAELWTPFNPVTIRGYVSDNSNSKLTVIIKNAFNNSRFSFDDELEENDQGGFDHSLFTQVPGMWSTLLGEDGDVITLNGNGWFELDLYLMAPNILDEPPETKKDNNVFFRVVDQAGNIEDDYETITYEPTSTVWGINTQETDPNEIYSSWLIHADYPAQLMFELVFHESVNFEDIELLNINFLPLDDGYDQITKELRIRMDDAQANLIRNDDLPGYLVILPFELAQNRDANELLYEKDSMQFNIKLEIDYSYKKEGQPKQTQYVQAVFSPQTPYDFSKFLTPEIVRNTLIPTFTDARDFVGKLSNFTYDNIIKPGLPICVVLMAYNAVKNYVNPLETFTASTNDPALKLMKVVCDRIFCPVVPPKGPNDDSVLGYSPNVGSQFNDLGVYREGGFLNRRETPCNPTVVNFGNTVNPIQSALMTTQQVGVYTVNSLATGLSTKRCYSNSYPFYDDLKCLFNKGGGDTDKNPMRDLVDSVQCGCAGGFYLQTQRIVRHLDEVLDCLEKLENGDVDAGYCEAILATSACELFQYVFEKIIEKRYDTKMYSTRDAVGKLTLSEMKNSYGDAITRVTAGEFTAASIVHKSCMLALGMDISDFNALLDNAIGAQDVEPKVGPVVVQSHLNSVNEADRTLQIQYKYTPYIQAGLGSDVTAKLIMFCDPEGIDSEYCPLRRDESVKINLGQIAKGTTLSTTGVYNDAPDAKVWYNKAFIEYTYRDRVLEDIDSVEYRCVPNNSCIGAGGSLQPGYEASLGCSSEQEACGFRTITSQATPEYVTKTTEPFDIIHRGGIKFGCIFDLNTYGGFYCGLGDESLPSANMELEDAAMAQAGTFYQGQDVVAFLTLNKRQFNKENFIVRYEIMDRNGNPRGDGLEIFNTQEVFKCPFGGVGETPELVLPVTIIKGESGTSTRVQKWGDTPITNTNNLSLTITKQTTQSDNSDFSLVSVDKIVFTFNDGNTKECPNPQLNPSSHDNIFTKNSNLSRICQSSLSGVLISELNRVAVYVTVPSDDFPRLDAKIGNNQFTITNSVSSQTMIGNYNVELELYYCANGNGACGTITSIDSNSPDYAPITYGADQEAQKDTLTFTMAQRPATCQNTPYLDIVHPLERSIVNVNDDRDFILRVTDDCLPSIGSSNIKYRLDGMSNFEGLTIDDSFDKYDGGNSVFVGKDYYTFSLTTNKLRLYNDYAEINLEIRTVEGEVDGASKGIKLDASTRSTTKYPECRIAGLSGSVS